MSTFSRKIEGPQKRKNAYWTALRLLSFRQRSEKELFERLRERKFPVKKVEKVISDLKEKRFIDDKKLTRDFILHRAEIHPEGRMLLKKRLFQRKIPLEIIDTALEKLVSEEKELQLALIAAKKKKRFLDNKKLPLEKLHSKIGLFLASRGFSREIIKETLLKI